MPVIRSFSDMAKENAGDDEEGSGTGPNAGNFALHHYSLRKVPAPRGNEGQPFIYHELQESALCGQHCLNNLLQQRSFTEIQLSNIAQQLNAEERMIGVTDSVNVDATGNFSIQVLRRALQKSHNIELTLWGGTHPELEDGFIINRREHWFPIRRINGKWFNLNSTSPLPEHISDGYLAAFLAQMRAEHYIVFAPSRGMLPKAGRLPAGYRGDEMDGRYWLREADVLNPAPAPAPGARSGAGGKDSAAAAPAPFSGKAQRLDGKTNAPAPQAHPHPYPQAAYNGFGAGEGEDEEEDPELAAAIAASLASASGSGSGSGAASTASRLGRVQGQDAPMAFGGEAEEDEDPDLALAIKMSLAAAAAAAPADNSSSAASASASASAGPPKSEKEIQREKRLAALAARGL